MVTGMRMQKVRPKELPPFNPATLLFAVALAGDVQRWLSSTNCAESTK